MSFSEDGKRAITYGAATIDGEPVGNSRQYDERLWNKQLQVWNVATGKEVWHHSALPYSTYSVFVKPDFKTMYVSYGGFDVRDIHSLRVIKHLNISHSSIRLSPDKKLFAVGGSNNVQFMDAKSQTIIRTYWNAGYATQVFWGPDSKTLLVKAWGSKPQAIDVATAKQIRYPRWFYRVRGSDAFAFSASGDFLAKAKGQRIEIWTTPTESDAGRMLNAFATTVDRVNIMQFSPDGKTLAVGGSSKTEVPVQFLTLSQTRK
jgi:WD40 repeat protein